MNLYDIDFYAWTQQQGSALKQHQWERLDLPNLREEIAALGRRERQDLRNRLGILLGHLLQWQYQPEFRGNRGLATVRETATDGGFNRSRLLPLGYDKRLESV